MADLRWVRGVQAVLPTPSRVKITDGRRQVQTLAGAKPVHPPIWTDRWTTRKIVLK